MQLLVNEISNQKYEYNIHPDDQTITIKLNSHMNMIVMGPLRSYLIMDHEGIDKIHCPLPKNIKCIPSKNHAMFTIKKQQNIIDNYLDLTSLYYELQHLKNDAINKW